MASNRIQAVHKTLGLTVKGPLASNIKNIAQITHTSMTQLGLRAVLGMTLPHYLIQDPKEYFKLEHLQIIQSQNLNQSIQDLQQCIHLFTLFQQEQKNKYPILQQKTVTMQKQVQQLQQTVKAQTSIWQKVWRRFGIKRNTLASVASMRKHLIKVAQNTSTKYLYSTLRGQPSQQIKIKLKLSFYQAFEQIRKQYHLTTPQFTLALLLKTLRMPAIIISNPEYQLLIKQPKLSTVQRHLVKYYQYYKTIKSSLYQIIVPEIKQAEQIHNHTQNYFQQFNNLLHQ